MGTLIRLAISLRLAPLLLLPTPVRLAVLGPSVRALLASLALAVIALLAVLGLSVCALPTVLALGALAVIALPTVLALGGLPIALSVILPVTVLGRCVRLVGRTPPCWIKFAWGIINNREKKYLGAAPLYSEITIKWCLKPFSTEPLGSIPRDFLRFNVWLSC